jgi:hypothetical protein
VGGFAVTKYFIYRGNTMKRTMFVPIATLLFAGAMFPVAAHAQTTVSQITPFNLTYIAYQGYFTDQGIPSAGSLIDAIVSKKIVAQDLIRAAVKINQLSVQTLDDRDYISNLESQMKGLTDR